MAGSSILGPDGLVGTTEVLPGRGVVSEVQVSEWPADRTPGSYPALIVAGVSLPPSKERPAVKVFVELKNVGGEFEAVRVTFSNHSVGRRPMSGADFRRLNLVDVVEDCYSALESEQLRRGGSGPLDPALLRLRRPGRRGHPVTFYARVAERFVELCQQPRVVERMAAEAGVSPKTMGRWVQVARARSLLTSRGKGRQGGELTRQCRQLLADHGADPGRGAG